MRLSGTDALSIANRCLVPPVGQGTYRTFEARFVLPDTAPFPVLVYLMRAPKSYTREDVLEIHAPGSPPLLAAITRELCRAGARLSEPGEFTRRAFLNGRIDLAQAEAVLAVIRSRSDAEEGLALSALAGDLSNEVARIRKGLVNLAVDIEAGLDFFDEEVNLVPRDLQSARICEARSDIAELLARSVTSRVFREDVLVVIYGPANAGKSTLFNALTGGQHAIVHDRPGTTRDFLEATVEIDAARFLVVDTAGVRRPAEVVEQIAVGRTHSFVREAQIVLFVVDASEPFSAQARRLYAATARLPHVVVLNKADKPLAIDTGGWRRLFSGADALEVSAHTGMGVNKLKAAIVELVHGGRVDLSTARFVLAERQRNCLQEADGALVRAQESLARGDGDEIISLEVKDAVSALGRITGDDYVEDLLDEVFSRFCLGK